MKKRNVLRLDVSGFEKVIDAIKDAGGNAKAAVTDALEQAGETVTEDTLTYLEDQYLPAGGKYSIGETKKSVIKNPRVIWIGDRAEIGVGFDYSKPGAGGFLITGTPRMKPDEELQRMYLRKAYMRSIQEDIKFVLESYIEGE